MSRNIISPMCVASADGHSDQLQILFCLAVWVQLIEFFINCNIILPGCQQSAKMRTDIFCLGAWLQLIDFRISCEYWSA
jgi:hypothetical protein